MGYNTGLLIIDKIDTRQKTIDGLCDLISAKCKIIADNKQFSDMYQTMLDNEGTSFAVTDFQNKVIIEDVSEVITVQELEEYSKKMNCEIFSLQNNETTDTAGFILFKNGEIVRRKNYGKEEEFQDPEIAEMLKDLIEASKDLGDPLPYEKGTEGPFDILKNYCFDFDVLSDKHLWTVYKRT